VVVSDEKQIVQDLQCMGTSLEWSGFTHKFPKNGPVTFQSLKMKLQPFSKLQQLWKKDVICCKLILTNVLGGLKKGKIL
jgi:hypothetical protein